MSTASSAKTLARERFHSPMDAAVSLTAMEYGGFMPIGLANPR
jgi:prolyl-tRNA editing enzyme YbaK/EbsC (Cys-tRNA(Pro) deacylase)